MLAANDGSRVDGLIVEPTKSSQYNPNLAYYVALQEAGIPLVMINAYYEELDLPHICVNDTRSGFSNQLFIRTTASAVDDDHENR